MGDLSGQCLNKKFNQMQSAGLMTLLFLLSVVRIFNRLEQENYVPCHVYTLVLSLTSAALSGYALEQSREFDMVIYGMVNAWVAFYFLEWNMRSYLIIAVIILYVGLAVQMRDADSVDVVSIILLFSTMTYGIYLQKRLSIQIIQLCVSLSLLALIALVELEAAWAITAFFALFVSSASALWPVGKGEPGYAGDCDRELK